MLSGSCPLPFGSCRLQINHRFQKGTHPIQITVNYILILHNPTLVGFFVCGGDGRFELVNINIEEIIHENTAPFVHNATFLSFSTK